MSWRNHKLECWYIALPGVPPGAKALEALGEPAYAVSTPLSDEASGVMYIVGNWSWSSLYWWRINRGFLAIGG